LDLSSFVFSTAYLAAESGALRCLPSPVQVHPKFFDEKSDCMRLKPVGAFAGDINAGANHGPGRRSWISSTTDALDAI
jgi:hypothetical protein